MDDLPELRRLLAADVAENGPRETVTLTDEELAVLHPVPPEARLVLTPELDRLTPAQRESAERAALRSLVAHGLVEVDEPDRPSPQETEADLVPVDLRLAPPIELVVTLRSRADRVLTLHQHTGAGRAHRYLYVHPAGGEHGAVVLEERVTAAGMHTFGLVDAAHARDLVRRGLDPADAATVGGPTIELSPAELTGRTAGSVLPDFDEIEAAATALLLRADQGPGHGRMVTTYARPRSLLVVELRSPSPESGAQAYNAGPATLNNLAADLVGVT